MSVIEVQARVASIAGRLDTLSARRATVDPAAAAAFAARLAGATSATTGAGTPGAAGTTAAAAAGATGPRTAGGPTGGDVVDAARRYLGVPYRWGGTDPATGLDCSGFVQRVFADLGVDLPRTVADQRHAGTAVASMADARPGDLLVFDSAGSPSGRHIGIYVGDGQMIASPKKGEDVSIMKVWDDVAAIRRVVPDGSAAPAAIAATAGVQAAARPAWAAPSTDLAGVFADATARYSLPEGLLAAVAQKESGMRADAVSPAGARGLMQLMPGTAKELGVDPMVPAQAVDGAARYLRQQLDAFGSVDLALAAYNAGPGAVRRHGGIPPYAETQNYVTAVMAAMKDGRTA
ncbi:transglycosylase SLT domain-containing protein [Aquipuribacter hungaricus]|uniref:Transglycosylase SLT domain-containing protein n=2 Tax=Aquipuribacter hungaricus TaxID=545624 RepID=A0ABV7WI86_9MICO